MSNFQEKVSFILDLVDLLSRVYKRNEYQKGILLFTVLKRFDCVLSDTKKNVLDTFNKYKEYCEENDMILSRKVEAHMKKELDEQNG